MAELIVPALYDAFDLETEMEASKARVPVLSAGRWTDTGNTNPGIVAGRVFLEELQRWLYSGSARFVADDVILHLASLLGIDPNPALFSEGTLAFNVAPGTVIQARVGATPGFQVADEVKGQVYEVKTGVTSATGGVVTLEALALVPGFGGNTRVVGAITGLRSAASAGTVYSVTNLTAFDGGRDAETVAEFKRRFPGLVQNDTVLRPLQFEQKALENGSVARAKVYRGVRPGAVTGQFILDEADHTTLVLLGPGGAAPSASVLTAVRDAILASTIFNLSDADPLKGGLHVLGARSRAVGVTGQLVAFAGAVSATVQAAAESAVSAYLEPLSGGESGQGFDLGRPPRIYEIGAILERVAGVDFVRDGSLSVTGATGLALDEVIAPGVVTFAVGYS